ncbi:MAG TPA: glycosyltransferase family 2 protein [Mycobacteriales bacterium]|jgi:GT2 family glycosyltransferase|nr:glycosyltransferase family 2 protein [Mycobacteriales bacterium]
MTAAQDGPVVSVVIVTYNNGADIGRALRSVHAATARHPREVVVLDNASADDTVERVAEAGGCRVLASPVNLGFARGCNAAAHTARGRYVLLVNPDAVLHPDAIDAAVDFAEAHPQAGPVGGRTLHPDGSLDPRSCWGRQTLWSTACFATGLSTALRGSPIFDPEALGGWERDSVREVGTVTGYFLLLRRADWLRLGGLDPTFFMYGDDVDLSERARRIGLRPTVTPDAVSEHEAGASSTSEDRTVMLLRGRRTLMVTSWARPRAAAGLALLRAGVLLRSAAAGDPRWRAAWRRRAEWTAPYPPVHVSAADDAATLTPIPDPAQ